MAPWTIAKKNNIKWLKAAISKQRARAPSAQRQRAIMRLSRAALSAQRSIGGGSFNRASRYKNRARTAGFRYSTRSRRYVRRS